MLALWLLAGVLLLTALGGPAVSRTQEARVLETARQMLGTGADGWLVPHINGKLRVQKPPLTYWMAATAYQLGGVGETVGRIPTVFVGWLTLGVTFAFASRLFDRRIALMSCAAMLGSLLFFKHVRLAETDAPATLFVTLAVYAIWRAAARESAPARVALWLHLAAAATSGAAMAKGLPAGIPMLFLIGFAAVERRGDLLVRFVTSGAVATALLIGSSWWLYIALEHGAQVIWSEVQVTAGGSDHFDWPIVYAPALLAAVAPWSGVLPLALIDAVRRWRGDRRLRMLLIWCAAILLPLCCIGNKQPHYLLPLIPPMMILIGWFLATATDPAHRMFRWTRIVLIGTLIASTGMIAAVLIVATTRHGSIELRDWIAAGAIAAGAILAAGAFAHRGTRAGFASLAMVVPLLMPLLLGWWAGGVELVTPRTIARQIRTDFGDGPYAFFGPNESLPLCFNLRAAIPAAKTDEELLRLTAPGTVVIAQTKNGLPPPPLPLQFVHRKQVKAGEQLFDLYVREPR